MDTAASTPEPAIGSNVIDADGDLWQRDSSGWRQVGLFGLLGTSVFTWPHLKQGMGPLYTW